MDLTLEQLKDLARSHWKRHRPKYYQNLKDSGELDKRVEKAARFTLNAFNLEKGRLEKKGYNSNQASEVWGLLPKFFARHEKHQPQKFRGGSKRSVSKFFWHAKRRCGKASQLGQKFCDFTYKGPESSRIKG